MVSNNSTITVQPQKAAACGRCSFSGLVSMQKDGSDFSFSCLCPRGLQIASSSNLKSYEVGLSKGFRLTDNAQLAFDAYCEYKQKFSGDKPIITLEQQKLPVPIDRKDWE